MVAQLNRLMPLLVLHGLLVQPSQADPVDSVRVEAGHHATTQKKMEPKEITIYISGQHKAMVAALLDAVDEGTPVTGIADFDSLSSTYGLMRIYRKGRRSSGFYGHRFRLTFPPAAEVAAIAGAYWNLAYIQSVEPEPPPEARARKLVHLGSGKRVAQKLISGAIVGGVVGGTGGLAGLGVGLGIEDCSDCPHGHNCDLCGLGPIVGSLIVGSIGCSIGTAVGVSRADPHDLFGASLIGSVVGFIGGIWLVSATESELLLPSLFIGPIVGATLASEWSRSLNPSGKKLPLFMNLVPDPRGRFSAIATLRF